METTLDEVTTEQFLALYRESFSVLDDKAAARQSLDDGEFREEMKMASVLKFVAWDPARQPVALAFVATDLSVVPWVSPDYYAARFPEHYARGAIYYFGALLARPDYRGGEASYQLVKELSRFVALNDGIAAFDCCQFNLDLLNLPDLVGRVGDEVCEIDRQHIDTQRYYAFLTSNLREDYSREPLPTISEIDTHPRPEEDVFIDLVALEEAERTAERDERAETAADRSALHRSNDGNAK